MGQVVTLATRADVYNFTRGRTIVWDYNKDCAVYASRWRLLKDRVKRCFKSKFGEVYICTAIDVENGTITFGRKPRWWERFRRGKRQLVHP